MRGLVVKFNIVASINRSSFLGSNLDLLKSGINESVVQLLVRFRSISGRIPGPVDKKNHLIPTFIIEMFCLLALFRCAVDMDQNIRVRSVE